MLGAGPYPLPGALIVTRVPVKSLMMPLVMGALTMARRPALAADCERG